MDRQAQAVVAGEPVNTREGRSRILVLGATQGDTDYGEAPERPHSFRRSMQPSALLLRTRSTIQRTWMPGWSGRFFKALDKLPELQLGPQILLTEIVNLRIHDVLRFQGSQHHADELAQVVRHSKKKRVNANV